MKPIHALTLASSLLLASGCTAVRVQSLDASEPMLHVCIQENPKVAVEDFVDVLREGFDRHAISTEVFKANNRPAHCEYVLTYTALRSWDMGPYLSHAELRIDKRGRAVASAEYHLRGKGGLSLTKWAGTKAKMDPVIDELLGSNGARTAANRDVTSKVPEAAPVASSANDASAEARLRELQRLKEQRLITDAEYEEKRRAILSEI